MFTAEACRLAVEGGKSSGPFQRRMEIVGKQLRLLMAETPRYVGLVGLLDLSRAQKEQIATILGDRDRQIDEVRPGLASAALAHRKQPSDQTHAAHIRAYTRLASLTEDATRAARRKVYDVLTPEQKARLDDLTVRAEVEAGP